MFTNDKAKRKNKKKLKLRDIYDPNQDNHSLMHCMISGTP
jgi:hypothetical protein